MSLIEWACAAAPLHGQTSSGDRGVVVPFEGGVLAAVIDGLGHGPEASAAAERAEAVLLRQPTAPVDEIMRSCHDDLRATRGAVITLATFSDAGTMTWLGVGNVEALLVRAESDRSEAVAARGGTVGYMLPPLKPRTLPVSVGDTLVLASDGIRHGFKQEIHPDRTPQEIADQILARWGKDSDDACVIVARYLGAAAQGATLGGSPTWAR